LQSASGADNPRYAAEAILKYFVKLCISAHLRHSKEGPVFIAWCSWSWL